MYLEADGGARRQLIIYGGMNGPRLGDVWILDLNSMTWDNPLVGHAPLALTLIGPLQIHGHAPLPRSLHTANIVGHRMYVYGGWVSVISADYLFMNIFLLEK